MNTRSGRVCMYIRPSVRLPCSRDCPYDCAKCKPRPRLPLSASAIIILLSHVTMMKNEAGNRNDTDVQMLNRERSVLNIPIYLLIWKILWWAWTFVTNNSACLFIWPFAGGSALMEKEKKATRDVRLIWSMKWSRQCSWSQWINYDETAHRV